MIINYFEEYDIDTSDIDNKLEIINTCDAENAGYFSHVFNNAIEYLFGYKEFNEEGLYNGLPNDITNLLNLVLQLSIDSSASVTQFLQSPLGSLIRRVPARLLR